MKEYTTDKIRNIALLGHGSAGKTTLVEAMLFANGAITRMGRVEEGNTVSDFDEEEIRRRISLSATLIPIERNGTKLNVLDTPGYTDFVGEVKSAVRVADLGLVFVDAVAGIEVGTELVWAYCDEQELPRAVLINKMDRDNANFERVLDQLKTVFQANFVPLMLPIGRQGNFSGVVDLVEMKARTGAQGEPGAVPADMSGEVESARGQLIEAAAESDDELIMKYLEGEELTAEEIRQGLRAAILKRSFVPVFCAAAPAALGVHALMDMLKEYAPSPADRGPVAATGADGTAEAIPPDNAAPLAALIFKTTADPYVGKLTYVRVYGGVLASDSRVFNANSREEERTGQIYVMRGKEQLPVSRLHAGDIGAMAKLAHTNTGDTLCDRGHPVTLSGPVFPPPLFSLAVSPKTKADSTKMGPTLSRIAEEDPTLRWRHEPSTHETILSGMGEAHLDTAVRRMEGRFGVSVETAIPRVPYQETITKSSTVRYRHKKQTGGAGQFGEVELRVEPLPRGEQFEYTWEVFGGAVSSSYQGAIEKGVKGVMAQGVIAGYPVIDVKVAVTDGKEHPVDSKPIAFEIASREAFKQGVQGASPILLEPINTVVITVPEEYTGDVMGDLNTKRARVQGMDQRAGKSVITAQAPLAEMQRYAIDLRSFTQGRGVFSMEFSHYEEVPPHVAQEIIARSQRERTEED